MLGPLAHGFDLLAVLLGLAGLAYLLFPRAESAAQSGRLDEAEPSAYRATTPVPRDSSTWRGLAVGSSVAAAGAHAAVVPHHLQEAWFVGLFFLAVTLAQAAWAVLVTLDATDVRVLVAGIAGSLGLLCLWTASRTIGLPLGLGREPVGGWDVACGVWELVVIGASLVGLRRPLDQRARVMGNLRPLPWTWAALSGLVLVVLTLTVSQH